MEVMREQENAKLIHRGKVIDVDRKIEAGFNKGKLIIAGSDGYEDTTLHIDFQNENLIAVLHK